MSNLDGWTPGHRPTRCHQLGGGLIRIVWTRHGMPDAHQTVTRADFDRLRARRTLPAPEPEEDHAA